MQVGLSDRQICDGERKNKMGTMLLVWAAALIFISMFAVSLSKLLKRAHRIDGDGIETDGVISRIEEDLTTADGGIGSTYTYVSYVDETGTRREGALSIGGGPYEVGQGIRIKYIPGEYDMVRKVKVQI